MEENLDILNAAVSLLIESISASDVGAGKPPSQFMQHSQDRFAAIADIQVPALAKIDPEGLAIPLWSEANLQTKKGLVSFGHSSRRRRAGGTVADQLLSWHVSGSNTADDDASGGNGSCCSQARLKA